MFLQSVEDPSKLRRVVEAMLLIGAELDLQHLLRHVIEEACSITGARYGAVGVLDAERTALSEFITVGLEPEVEDAIGHRPKGVGVLGLLITEPESLRISDVNSHPGRFGFPEDHPPMTSFLGVPIRVRNEVYGNLYLTDKVGWSEFTSDDQVLVEALALAAGIAVENARLHQSVKVTAVQSDRERVAGDLHDRVIGRLFGAGLRLQGIAGDAGAGAVSDRLNAVVSDLDDTIKEIRSTIFEMSLIGNGWGVRDQVAALLRELDSVVGFEMRATFDGPVDSAITDEVGGQLLITLREAVTNIGRHAEATEASVVVSVRDGSCRLEVRDNGRGIGEFGTTGGGLGMTTMRRRAEGLDGTFAVSSGPDGGTTVEWQVPVI